jgi:hypothetical protein
VGVDNESADRASIHFSSMYPTCLQNLLARSYTSPTAFTEESRSIVINGTGGLAYNHVEGNLPTTCHGCCFGTVRINQTWTLNAVNGARMLLGTDYLYESTDAGEHFDSLGGIGTNAVGGPIPLNPVGTVTAYAYGHPSAPNAFYVGTAGNVGGHLLWLRPESGYPTPIDTYSAAGGSAPRDIAFDPRDWRSVYIADDRGKVWHTADAGATIGGWIDLTGSQAAGGYPLGAFTSDLRRIRAVSPQAGRVVVLVAGLGGVFATGNPSAGVGAVWTRFGANMPNAIVTDLHYDSGDDLVLAGTLGRGAWTMPRARESLLPLLGLDAPIDIKPGSGDNPINLTRASMIPVAIPSTDIVDSSDVLAGTACFGADPPDPSRSDCTESHATGHLEDVNGDGRVDLVLHFDTIETRISVSDTQACLSAETTDGRTVQGCDAIRIVSPK